MRQITRFLGCFLFTAILLIKVSALHAYSHNDSDDIKDCTTCTLSLENQQDDLIDFNVASEIYLNSFSEFDKDMDEYESIYSDTFIPYFLFGRPPPSSPFFV